MTRVAYRGSVRRPSVLVDAKALGRGWTKAYQPPGTSAPGEGDPCSSPLEAGDTPAPSCLDRILKVDFSGCHGDVISTDVNMCLRTQLVYSVIVLAGSPDEIPVYLCVMKCVLHDREVARHSELELHESSVVKQE